MTDKPLPQPTPAEPRAIWGIPVRLDPTFAKDEMGIERNGKIVARVKVPAEPRIETEPEEWTAELPRDNRFHDPFEAGAQPEPGPDERDHTDVAPPERCKCVCHKVGLFGFLCCPCTIQLIQEFADSGGRARAGSSLSPESVRELAKRYFQTTLELMPQDPGNAAEFLAGRMQALAADVFKLGASPPSSPGAPQQADDPQMCPTCESTKRDIRLCPLCVVNPNHGQFEDHPLCDNKSWHNPQSSPRADTERRNAWAFPRYFLMDEALEIVARDEVKESRRQGGDNSDQNGIAHPSNQTVSSDVNGDEAKEASDDGRIRSYRQRVGAPDSVCISGANSGKGISQVTAPVATSVSAPTEAELEKQWIADGSTNSFKTWLIRKVQGASSSSAALDWAENMIAHYLKCGYLPELSAVEAKNFLGEPLPDKQKWSNPYDELREARDSRDRLQELADELVKTDGHRLTPRCSFAGCDCGGVEAYKVARSNYVRERRAALGDPPQKGGAH